MCKKISAMLMAALLILGTAPRQTVFASVDQDAEVKINRTLSAISLADRVSLMYGGAADTGAGATRAVTGLGKMNMSDGPNGVNAGGAGTSFESGLIVSATWNPDHAREVGRIIGAEAKAKNVQIMLGPGVNIIRDLAGGRTFEYYSEDPVLTGRIGAAYVGGMQSQEVSATVKHLFANNQESNRNWSTSNLSERAIHEIYLQPYKAAIEQGGAWSLMTGANRVNGAFTSDNRYILTNMMKYDYGLEGIIMTDWCGVRSNVISAKAGLDVSMPGASAYAGLLDAVRAGLLPGQVVDTAAQRVARLAYYTKSTTNADGYRPSDRAPGESYNVGSHANESVELAKEGEVLLKNDGLLPFAKVSPTIALVGKYVDYNFEQPGLGGSSGVTPPVQVQNGAAIRNLYDNYYIPGGATLLSPAYSEASESSLVASINAAREAAAQADYVVIYAGINKSAPEHQWGNAPDTEGNDRLDLDFPEAQLRLIRGVSEVAGAKTVVVLNGSVFEVADWVDGVNAVLTTFYPGQNGATATADILAGLVNPSGKLPFTWPRRYEDTQGYVPDVPAGGNQETVKNVEANYTEGVFEGYRYYDLRLHDADPENDILPQFAFGHGLSYATYDWSGLTLSGDAMGPEDTITVGVTLTNTNNTAGKQVVQLYVRDPVSSVPRPWKELKDFQKKAIGANGSQTFTFAITKDDLSFWDVNTHAMKAEAGQFEILVGDASDSIRASAAITLAADSAPDPDYTVVQAEAYASQSGASVGEAREVDSAVSYAPNQYVMLGGGGSYASWHLTVLEAGRYSLIFRYSNDAFSGSVNGTTEPYNRQTELVVNGESCGRYDFQNTRRADVWNYDSIDVVLDAGINTVTLRGTEWSSGVRVDKLIVQKIRARWPDPVASADLGGGLEPTDDNIFQAETATLLSGAVIENSAGGYTGEGYVVLRGAGSSATIPVYAPTSVRFRLQLTYANGTGAPAPCDLYVNGVKKYTYALGPTGGDGLWRSEQTDEITMLTGTNMLLIESQSGVVSLDKIEIIGGMGYLDAEAPVVNGTSPGDGGRWTGGVSAYYSESVAAGPGSVTVTDGTHVIPSGFTVEGAKLAVTLDPSRLQSGVTYTVTIGPDAALDLSGNGLVEPYVFTFLVPPANYDDLSIAYSGAWTDTGTAKTAGAGASLDFWYYGDECVLRAAQSGGASVNVWFDDALMPETVTLTDGGGQTAAFFSAGARPYGLHCVKVEVTSGTLAFVGANVNTALVSHPLSKAGWTATGVRDKYPASDGLAHIVDGNRASRWTSGEVQVGANRDWFAIEFSEPLEINALLLVCRQSNVGSDILDYTRAYECFVSDDGVNWSGPVAAGPGSPMFTNIIFPTRTTRFVKVVQTGNAPGDWWSVYEAYGFRLPDELAPKMPLPSAPTGLTAVRLNQQIQLTWDAPRGSAGVSRYRVYRDDVLAGYASGLGYVDILGAGDDTAHIYTVRAIDAFDNASAPSAAVAASTDPGAVDLPRAGWRADASHSHATTAPQLAVDADPESRWTAGAGVAPGMWFTVDMGLSFKFNAITVKGNATDYPTAYEIVSSDDGVHWSVPLAAGTGAPGTIDIVLAEAATARYIRINQTGAARGDWWSIYDINAALRDDLGSPHEVSAAGYNGFIRVDWFAPSEVFFAAHHYDVYRDGALVRGGLADTRYVDTDVRPNKIYTYEIVAVASGGENTPKSEPARARCRAENTQIPRNNWSADASAFHPSHPPALVLDDIDVPDDRTKWSTGARQDGSQVFYLHLNDVYPVNTLRISSDSNDYGRQYEIKALVGGAWKTVAANVAGQPGLQEIRFDQVYTDDLQICNTGTTGSQWWAIYELYAFNIAAPAPVWSIDDAAVSAAGVSVTVSRGADQAAAHVIVAAYAADGRLLATEIKPVTADGVYPFSAPPPGAARVRAFLWDDAYAPLDAPYFSPSIFAQRRG